MGGLLTLHPPIRLVSGTTNCYQCGAGFAAVAIVAVIADEHGHADTGILSYIEEMPEQLLQLVKHRFPGFGCAHSATAELDYYGNTCPRCGALVGDHYLQTPGGLFFPMSEDEKAALIDERVPIEGPLVVTASCGFGVW